MISRRAFTLAEVLLALALITVALLSLIGLCVQALHTGSKSADLSVGVMLAEQEVERLAYAAENAPGSAFWTTNSATTVYASQTVTVGNGSFDTSLYVTDVGGVFAPPAKRLKQIHSVVTWTDAGSNGRPGQGRLRATAVRLLHEP